VLAYNLGHFYWGRATLVAAAIVILAFTYAGIIFTRLPKINFDRTIAAMAGGILMVMAGILTFGEAVEAVNFDTLALLLGMMLLIVALQRAGLFELMAARSVAVATDPCPWVLFRWRCYSLEVLMVTFWA
jgi:Na+/H+ antiporter NhaD/arsenite permease-like protein